MELRRIFAVAAALACLTAAAQAPQSQQSAAQVETIPRGAAPDAELPTIIALHGRGGDARGFAGFVRRLAPTARIISLQAPMTLDGRGYTWMLTRVAHRDATRITRDIQAAVRGLVPRLASVTQDAQSCGRPIVVGYSQGGVLALALAAEGAKGVGALVDLAGALPPRYPVEGATGARIVSIHARGDAIVPIAHTRTALEALRGAGADVTAVEIPGTHDPSERMRAEAATAIAALLRAECPADAGKRDFGQ